MPEKIERNLRGIPLIFVNQTNVASIPQKRLLTVPINQNIQGNQSLADAWNQVNFMINLTDQIQTMWSSKFCDKKYLHNLIRVN